MSSHSKPARRFVARAATLSFLSLAASAQSDSQPASDLLRLAELPNGSIPVRGIEATIERLTVDENRLYWDRSPDGVVWVRGHGFKASFSGEGASITPFLGSDAPRNYPVTFALQRATVGGVEIAVEHGVDALHEGANVRFERGVIVETYDLDARSIEQSFDLYAPVGTGDLALRIAFQSELEARQTADGIEFRNERGGLDYTHAVAIDARGEVIEMPAMLVDGAIEIVVPGTFLASSTYPVRIDPTVFVSGVDVSTLVHRAPDVAYTFQSTDSMVAFERVFSAADSDIAITQVSQGGAVVNGFYVDITNDSWRSPSLASVRWYSRYLVAAARVPAGGGESRVWGRMINSNATPFSDQFEISGTETGDVSDVQVGGWRTEDSNGKFLVLWVRDSNPGTKVMRRVVEATAAFASPAITNTSNFSDSHPRVSNADASGVWWIVWQRLASTQDHHNVILGEVQVDGTQMGTPLLTSNDDEVRPNISMFQNGTNRFVVTYQFSSSSSNYIVRGAVMEGTTILNTVFPSLAAGDSGYNCVDSSVETDGSHFLFTYRRTDDSLLRVVEYFLLHTAPTAQNGLVGAETVDTGISGRPALASRFAAGSTSRRHAIVWSRADDIWLARVDGRVGGPYEAMCFGDGTGTQCPCGNNGSAGRGCANTSSSLGARLAGSGNALMGADTLLLTGSSMPPNTSCLYFQGTIVAATPAVFGDGLRCATGTIVRLATKVNSPSGASSYPGPGDQPVSIRGALPAAGGIRSYQLWYRNAADFCTSSTFNLSNGFRVTFTN